jgi:hypothetical protein
MFQHAYLTNNNLTTNGMQGTSTLAYDEEKCFITSTLVATVTKISFSSTDT